MKKRRPGFTLIELLIVIATLAVLAGVIIPEFDNSVWDTRRSAVLADLHMLTTAIERYKMHHDGVAPDDLSDQTLQQLSNSTDWDGNIGSGSEYPFGPYLINGIPENPLNGSRVVFQAPTIPPQNLENYPGWLYDPETGQIWAGQSKVNHMFAE